MAARYRWKKLLLLTMALLAAVLWLVVPGRLSPLEQSLVGTWYSTTGTQTHVLELRPDRRLLFRALDGQEIGPGRKALAGQWRVRERTLICDERSRGEALIPVHIVPEGPNIAGVELPALRWVSASASQILNVTAEEFTVQAPDSTPRTWKRYVELSGK